MTCLTLLLDLYSNGTCLHSSFTFALYGAAISVLGCLDEGYEYGRLALHVQETYGTKQTIARTFAPAYWFVLHLRQPILASLDPLEQAIKNGIQVGDVHAASSCLLWRVSFCLHGNMKLDHLEAQIRSYCNFLREYNLESYLGLLLPTFQLVLNLLGKAENVHVLEGEAVENTSAFVAEQANIGNDAALAALHNSRIILLTVLGELDLAGMECRKTRLEGPGTHYSMCCHHFFHGLVYLGVARKLKLSGQGIKSIYYRRLSKKYRKRLEPFVQNGSINCIPFTKILDAESLSLGSTNQDYTMKVYREAISAAAHCGFRLYKGLACEKAGEYLLGRGEKSMAGDYLKQAWYEYSDYGAIAKLTQMQRKYRGICSFTGNIAVTRPSSLTKPHKIRSPIGVS